MARESSTVVIGDVLNTASPVGMNEAKSEQSQLIGSLQSLYKKDFKGSAGSAVLAPYWPEGMQGEAWVRTCVQNAKQRIWQSRRMSAILEMNRLVC
jgi:hypothetical protein